MTDNLDERWPEVQEAIQLSRAGNPEAGVEILERYILEQKGRLSWGLYHATHLLEVLQQWDSEQITDCPNSESLFRQLVPDHITRTDLATRLCAERENLLMLYEDARDLELPRTCKYVVALETNDWGRTFRENLRVFSEEEFLDFVWLEDGYNKWVDLSLFEIDGETTYVAAKVGGRVETFREVYHHDEGYAPFRTR